MRSATKIKLVVVLISNLVFPMGGTPTLIRSYRGGDDGPISHFIQVPRNKRSRGLHIHHLHQ